MSSSALSSDRLDFQRGVQSEPLTDKDIETIHRYLSDPTVFPREFKKWITDHSSDTVDIAKTQVHGLVNGTGQIVISGTSMAIMGGVLCGCVLPFAAASAPIGWVLCDGRELVRAEYQALFNLIGVSWGSPSGTTMFKVPDFRGRAPFGVDGNVPFAGNEGAAPGARGPRHYHRVTTSPAVNVGGSGWTTGDGMHSHAMGGGIGTIAGSQPGTSYYPDVNGGLLTGESGHHNHGFEFNGSGTVNIDTNTADATGQKDQPGWLGLNWIMGSGKTP